MLQSFYFTVLNHLPPHSLSHPLSEEDTGSIPRDTVPYRIRGISKQVQMITFFVHVILELWVLCLIRNKVLVRNIVLYTQTYKTVSNAVIK